LKNGFIAENPATIRIIRIIGVRSNMYVLKGQAAYIRVRNVKNIKNIWFGTVFACIFAWRVFKFI
jgi:hypothetical protein